MNASATTISDLIAAFNERLVALVATDTGLRTTVDEGFDPKWANWHIIDFSVRDQWQSLGERGNTGNERWDDAQAEPAYPQFEWEKASEEAMYWDDISDLQCPAGSYSLCRFAVDPARIDAVMALVQKAPVVSDSERAEALADSLSQV